MLRYGDHCAFRHIGSGSLYNGVDRLTFSTSALLFIAIGYVMENAPAFGECADESSDRGGFDDALVVFLVTRKRLMPLRHVFSRILCLHRLTGSRHTVSQHLRSHSVYETETDRLRESSLGFRHTIDGPIEANTRH